MMQIIIRNCKNLLILIMAIMLSTSMLTQSSAVITDDVRPDHDIHEEINFFYVIHKTPQDRTELSKDVNVQVIKEDKMASVVAASEDVMKELGDVYQVAEIPDRTRVRMMETGVDFDSRAGFDVPREWKAENSELYLVQFVVPADIEWVDRLSMESTALFNMIGDNLAVVKMTHDQASAVGELPFIEWMDHYHPYYKVYQKVREQTGEFNVRITPFDVTVDELATSLEYLGAETLLVNEGCNKVEARLNDRLLPEIAKLDSVGLIEFKNKDLSEVNQQCSLTGEIVGAHVVWDQTRNNLPLMITGQGQVYHHQDLGLDDTHLDFAQGPLGDRVIYCQDTGDPDDHSTACVGIAAGNGYCMEGWLGLDNSNRQYYEIADINPLGMLDRAGMAGRAPETYIVAYDNLNTGDMPRSYDGTDLPGDNCSRVFSHSWAESGNVENGYWSDVDSFMLGRPNGIVCFCACNWGPNEMTVTGYGNCKNGLSIGAAEGNRGDWFQSDDNCWGLWTGSAKGPVSATDMRVKPDVVEFGAGVVMPQSDDEANHDNSLYRGANNDASLEVDYDGDGRCDYRKNQGTSFSAPAAAGDCILIRDYLVDVLGYDNNPTEGPNEPDALLIKAFLIHGAQDMGFGFPSYGQGWGLCNPMYSICPPAPLSNQYWSGTGSSGALNIEVMTSAAPLKVTMCHWDTGTASGALTVDYDLVVTAPDGTTTYYGNAFQESRSIPLSPANDWSGVALPSWSAYPSAYPTGAYDWDTSNDGGDDINNVEVILIDAPEKGIWTIEVAERSGAADWHVVASADFGPQNTYQIEVKQDANMTYHMRDGYGFQSYQTPPGGTVAVGFTVQNFGTSTDTIDLTATYQGDGYFVGDPLPSGWSVAFDTGTSFSLASDEIRHVTAYVTAPGAATAEAHPIRITASSAGSISEDHILFNIDVIDQRLPNRVRVTDTPLSEMNPGIAVWSNYVVVSYLQDTGIGERVFVSVSSDNGQTFGDPIPVTTFADDPQCIETKCAPAGHNNAGRVFIGYNSMKPLVNGDTWQECTNRRCVVCYADPPYTTWNIRYPFNNGDGPDTYNDYREIDIGFYNPDEIHFIENNYYFGTSNNMNQNPNSISPYERLSVDGGNSWGSGTSLSVGGSNQYGPGCDNDADGDLCFTTYMTGTDRKMYYRNYAGSWGGAVMAMEFPPNDAMWGYSGGDPANDRYYVCAGQSSGNNYNDFKLPYVTYTDNDGGSFAAPRGALGGPNNDCDNGHFDSNKMMDMDVTADSVAWVTAKQHPTSTSNGYWTYNLYSASSPYTDGYSSWTDNFVTRDSFTKEPAFRATRQGNNLLVAYNAFETGPSDVFLLTLYDGWMTDLTDNLGPITRSVQVPTRWIRNNPLNIGATMDEFNTGYNNVAAAEYRWDFGAATAMGPVDGGFNSVAEAAEQSDMMNLVVGWHYIEVRAQDSVSNWGPWTGKWVYVYSKEIPDAPGAPFQGLESVFNPGTGNTLTLFWTAAADPNGNEFPITYHVYRSETQGFIPDNGTNRIDMSTQTTAGEVGNVVTWDDITVVEGVTYYYVVRAEDTGGDPPGDPPTMEMNTEERSGTAESLLFFQVQSPGAGYRNLNLDPLEATVQTGATDVMVATGEYQVDTTDGKWVTSAIAGPTGLDGEWRFYVYGQMNNDHANGNLYARVFRYSDGLPLFTTGYDDEDIANYVGSHHRFEWSYIASGVTLPDGDSFYVELWLHVTGVSSGPGPQTVYDYTGGDAAWGVGTDRVCYYIDSEDSPPTIINSKNEITIVDTINNPPYDEMAAQGDSEYSRSGDPGSGDWSSISHIWNISEAPGDIMSIDLHFAGYVSRADSPDIGLYAWNHVTSSWTFVASGTVGTSAPGSVVSGILSGVDFTEYLQGPDNTFEWLVHYYLMDSGGGGTQTRIFTDYARATVTTGANPDGVFTFAYDNEVTPSSLHWPSSLPPPPQAYDIDLAGFLAGDWVFVSFPIEITGDVPTIFDDSAFGDGGTTWDCVQWFDNVNKVWTDYNVYKP
ncbi:MAG: hypothetical protein AYK23_01355, partial [Candidatus Proteinoplasmatales archaeon SG8-5]